MCVCPSRESCESHPPEFTPSLPYPVQLTLTPKLKSKLAVIPDLNGLRFCRVCNHFLPLAKFPSGVRRFVCRQHLWQQVGKQARDTLLAKPGQKMITRLWLRCYKDAKVFRQPRIELKYDDIRELVSDSRISAEKFAIVPARPEAPVSKGNAVLVARDTRDQLLEILRHNTTSLSTEGMDLYREHIHPILQ